MTRSLKSRGYEVVVRVKRGRLPWSRHEARVTARSLRGHQFALLSREIVVVRAIGPERRRK